MNRTIGIIAPLTDRNQFHPDFILRLRSNNRELTLAALHELAGKEFNPDQVSRGFDYEEIIPSAGYYLQGLLHQQGYDTFLTNRSDSEILLSLAKKDPFAILVSTTMITSTDTLLELFSSIRRTLPDTPIIAGGIFIWKNYLLYQDHLRSPQQFPLHPSFLFHPDHAPLDADILVVAPHGKTALLQTLVSLEKGKQACIEEIPNLVLRHKTGFFFTRREEEQVDYNEDFTRWDLIDELPVKLPLRTSIGCPYRCSFCDFYRMFPTVFLRSEKSLSAELKMMKDRLGRTPAALHVSDDNVFITRKRIHEVCNAIIGSGFRNWAGFMRSGEYSETEMDLIVRSGLMLGFIGVESGDPGQLERMNKRQDIEKVKRGIEQFDDRGISTMLTFVIGLPGETQQSLGNTINFMNSLRLTNLLTSYRMFTLFVEPLSVLNTPAFRAKWNLTGSLSDWSHYTMNSGEVNEARFQVFKGITDVPYHYGEESNFFNRAKFRYEVRKTLIQLRQELTVKMIEQAPWELVEPLLKDIAQQMNKPIDTIPGAFRDEIFIHYPPQLA
jgi:radical SAM superfamily enzyme YgiQ (UPF0313 family)